MKEVKKLDAGNSQLTHDDVTDGLRKTLTSQTRDIRDKHQDVTEQVLKCAAKALNELKLRLEQEKKNEQKQLEFAQNSMKRLKDKNENLPIFKMRAVKFCRKLEDVELPFEETSFRQTSNNDTHDLKQTACLKRKDCGLQENIVKAQAAVNNNALVSSKVAKQGSYKTREHEDFTRSVDSAVYADIARDIHRYSSKILEVLERLTRQHLRSTCEKIRQIFRPAVSSVLVGVLAGSLAYFGTDGDLAFASGVGLATGLCVLGAARIYN